MNYSRAAITAAVVFLVLPTIVFGAGLTRIVPQNCDQIGGCQNICDLGQLASNLLNDGILVAIFLSAVLFAWAGWLNLTSMGDTNKISSARRIFWYVVVGLLIILSAWIIVNIIMFALTGKNTWNNLCDTSSFASHGPLLAVDR